MKICFILEGCYPYVYGGVSTWVNQYILSKPEHEFVLLTIGANKKDKGKFVYDLPKNVVEIKELFLDDDQTKKSSNNIKNKINIFSNSKEKYSDVFLKELKKLILGKEVNWKKIFDEVNSPSWNTNDFFEGKEYLKLIKDIAKRDLKTNAFIDIFFGIKSMLKPLLQLLSIDIPEADIYHSASTGYAGILGSLAQYKTNKPFILTEHGIYPREREEELLACTWLDETMKKIWINFFYNISGIAYKRATYVTSLFEAAKETQIILGCDEKKCVVVPNGIHYEQYEKMSLKEDNGYIDIGAFIRFSMIKDVKTLLYSFYETHSKCKSARLHIFGATNDQEYAKECMGIIKNLGMENCVKVYGQINPMNYMPKMDFTILTSISEGQPLTILESFAARRPVVCTNVGCCKELINGNRDGIGKAGICCTPMDISGIAKAMIKLCQNKELRLELGENGLQRVKKCYKYEKMMDSYFELYEKGLKNWQE